MKHLRLEVLTTKWGKMLRVVEQTHRNDEFGEMEMNWFLHEDFQLRSDDFLDLRDDGLHVRGHLTAEDHAIIIVPSEAWLARCRAAVKAYNQRFAETAEPVDSDVEVIE
jgi:hypothetical protein